LLILSGQYPDVVSLVKNILAKFTDIESFILDAEIVAIDPADGSLQSFQELSNRARRDVKIDEVKVSVSVFAFDLMCLNGEASVVFASVNSANSTSYIRLS
jgi:DNA ligase 1